MTHLNQLIKWSPDAVNIQCDAGWFSDSQKIRLGSYFFKTMKAHKIPVIITLHEERKETVSLFKKASAIIFYYQPKYYNELIPNKHFVFDLPACPFSPSCSKSELRKKYNYNDEDFILTTCGTAYREKKIPEIIEAMTPFLKINPHIKLQLIISPHKTLPFSKEEMNKINELVENSDVKEQIFLAGKYTPTDEYFERLHLSNLGFAWYDGSLTSSSAVEKDFISARLPLIANDSPHFHLDNGNGLIKVNGDMNEFLDTLYLTIKDSRLLHELSIKMGENYIKNNYGEICIVFS